MLAIAFVVWAAAAIAAYAWQHGDAPVKADAVFVLSGSPARLPVGLRLVRQGYAPLLVVSRTIPDPTALEQQACAHRLGVRVLCVQASPYSTVGESELIGRLAAARGWHRLDVVTSQYHVIRSRILLRRCYHGSLAVVGAPVVWWLWPWTAALESVKLVYHELDHRNC